MQNTDDALWHVKKKQYIWSIYGAIVYETNWTLQGPDRSIVWCTPKLHSKVIKVVGRTCLYKLELMCVPGSDDQIF